MKPTIVRNPPSRLTHTSEWILRAAKPSDDRHSGCSPTNDPASALNVAPVATSDPTHVRASATRMPTNSVTASCPLTVLLLVDVKLENPNWGLRLLGVAETWIRLATIVTGTTITSTMRISVHALRR